MRSARHLERSVRFGWQAAGSINNLFFPSCVLAAATEFLLPFVGDYAGGNRSLARVCFYRLKTAAFYLATSRSHAGRPQTHHLP